MTVAGNLKEIRRRIDAAAGRAGRTPAEVTLIGVTKTVAVGRIREAVDAGLADLGENRVQEAAAKVELIPRALTWHLIGHLQSNKARQAAQLFDCIHSVDSIELARRLDSAIAGREEAAAAPAEAGNRSTALDVLIQVDQAAEPTKHGIRPALLPGLIDEIAKLSHLRLIGLMSLPPLFEDPERSRPYFADLRKMRDGLSARGISLPYLSMGMSNDFEVAIEEGATMVRVGRALFGDRA